MEPSRTLIRILKQTEVQESLCQKVMRRGFASLGILLSYGTLIPSVLTANAFDPFPGASQISAAAVVVNFGTFGADNYIGLSHILFKGKKNSQATTLNAGNIVRIAISIVLGVVSRFPGAGITLKIAPGIPPDFRLPLAILNIFGTCSPEIVSTYNSLDFNLRDMYSRFTQPFAQTSAEEKRHALVKENFQRCIRGLQQRFLTLSAEERCSLATTIDSLSAKLAAQPQTALQKLMSALVNEENHAKARASEDVHRRRRWLKVLIGITTSAGTCYALAQNALFTKFAIDYFFPEDALWKWAVSTICALTIAHTSFKMSYLAAYQWADSAAHLWGNKQNTQFSETFYPKTNWLLTLFSSFWAFALYGILYESAKASVDMDTWGGIAFFAGNFFASFFLIYAALQSVGEKAILAWANSRFAQSEAQLAARVNHQLLSLDQFIQQLSPDECAAWLAQLHEREVVTELQMDIANYTRERDFTEESPLLPEETQAVKKYQLS